MMIKTKNNGCPKGDICESFVFKNELDGNQKNIRGDKL